MIKKKKKKNDIMQYCYVTVTFSQIGFPILMGFFYKFHYMLHLHLLNVLSEILIETTSNYFTAFHSVQNG